MAANGRLTMRGRLAALLTITVALPVYLATMARTISWAHEGGDGGDLITAAALLAIPHPTGYPTYVLLGRLAAAVPVGEVAFRLTLLSALLAAATVGLVAMLLVRLAPDLGWRGVAGATCGALLLAFAPLFWAQALVVEVYVLTLFHATLLLVLALPGLRGEAIPGRRWLAIGLASGTAMGNHLMLLPFLLTLPPLLLWSAPPGARGWRSLLAGLAVGLTVYLLLPLRAGVVPVANWGNPADWRGLWWLVSGALYRPLFFARQPTLASLGVLPTQAGGVTLALALVGLPHLWRRERRLLMLLAIGALGAFLLSESYGGAETHAYRLGWLLPLAVVAGVGATGVLTRVGGRWRGVLLAIGLLLLPLGRLATHYRAMDVSDDRVARRYGEGVLETLPPGAILLQASDRESFVLVYLTAVGGARPDVTLINLNLLRWPWYRRNLAALNPTLDIEAVARDPFPLAALARRYRGDRPLYVGYQALAPEGYTLYSHGAVYAVVREPPTR